MQLTSRARQVREASFVTWDRSIRPGALHVGQRRLELRWGGSSDVTLASKNRGSLYATLHNDMIAPPPISFWL